MKKLFFYLVLFFVFIQFGLCQIIPIDSCIVWQKSICNTSHIDISQDNKYIATACPDGFIRIYNVDNGNLYKEFRANSGYVYTVKYSYNGNYLVSVGQDGIIRIWDTFLWDTIKTIKAGEAYGKYYATISPNNRYIAATREFEDISLWDFNTGQLIKNYPPLPPTELNGGPLGWSVEFSPDDKYIAVAIDFNPGRLINIENDSATIIDNSNYVGRTFYATVSKDGTKFLTGYEDLDYKHFGVNVYDIVSKSIYKNFVFQERIIDLDVSPNNELMVVCNGSQEYYLWNLETGQSVTSWLGGIAHARFTPDTNYLLIQGGTQLILINLRKITTVGENNLKGNNEIINIYPNPSGLNILIEFNIKELQKAKLSVENISGNEIKILYNNFIEQGIHQINWNTSEVANGEYFIKLVSGNSIDVRKVIINK